LQSYDIYEQSQQHFSSTAPLGKYSTPFTTYISRWSHGQQQTQGNQKYRDEDRDRPTEWPLAPDAAGGRAARRCPPGDLLDDDRLARLLDDRLLDRHRARRHLHGE